MVKRLSGPTNEQRVMRAVVCLVAGIAGTLGWLFACALMSMPWYFWVTSPVPALIGLGAALWFTRKPDYLP